MKGQTGSRAAIATVVAACLATFFLGGCSRAPATDNYASSVAVNYSFVLERPAASIDYQNLGFKSGERFRFNLAPEQDCYIYLLNEGTDGTFTLLLPSGEVSGGANLVAAHRWVEIPPRGWYRLDTKPGIEHLIVVASAQALSQLESLRNRASLDPNQVRAALKSVDDLSNMSTQSQAREPKADHVRQSATSLDEHPILKFQIDMIHE